MNIRRGDTVLVIAGKDKDKRGRVERVLPQETRAIVEGANIITRHVKAQPGIRQAGRVQREAPIHISNVMLICNKCNKPARVRVRTLDDGRKVRACQNCKEAID